MPISTCLSSLGAAATGYYTGSSWASSQSEYVTWFGLPMKPTGVSEQGDVNRDGQGDIVIETKHLNHDSFGEYRRSSQVCLNLPDPASSTFGNVFKLFGCLQNGWSAENSATLWRARPGDGGFHVGDIIRYREKDCLVETVNVNPDLSPSEIVAHPENAVSVGLFSLAPMDGRYSQIMNVSLADLGGATGRPNTIIDEINQLQSCFVATAPDEPACAVLTQTPRNAAWIGALRLVRFREKYVPVIAELRSAPTRAEAEPSADATGQAMATHVRTVFEVAMATLALDHQLWGVMDVDALNDYYDHLGLTYWFRRNLDEFREAVYALERKFHPAPLADGMGGGSGLL